ncbi:hypothetical protein BDU57DRAFT_588804 [Ampelomyces quisqualis]|uniref:RBR-type E3 ubiquitin transferase n=1 Tax=Ampelomyces quisqualis TaxID=50730 RepID=A0A6A5QJ43_AMPQU|nr:hypothetical protein BDU57DRAFT_588804 [Ampelomyces quisqualis]
MGSHVQRTELESKGPKPRAPPPTHSTCRICIEEKTTDQFPTWTPPEHGDRSSNWDVPMDCMPHLSRNPDHQEIDPVCKTCIGNAMSARLDQLGARKVGVGCIEPGCQIVWSWDFIMRYLPAGEATEKYNLEMFEVWKRDAEIKPVTCTAPECDAVGLPDHTAPGYPQVSCHACLHRSCSLCLVSWHKDVTCTEYAAKKVDVKMSDLEKETLELIQRDNGKRCPNCYLVIVKEGGCDSMYCRGCRKYFNWTTAASAVPGARKAQPYKHGNPRWTLPPNVPPVICEMDAMQMAGTSSAVEAA